MARRWTAAEEYLLRNELEQLYVRENKTIAEVGALLGLAPQTVFDRLKRLGIPSCRNQKPCVLNARSDIRIPTMRSAELAEIFGILFGDGHITHFQMCVNLGSKELEYATYVCDRVKQLFGKRPNISTRKSGHRDVYLGSTTITDWLYKEGCARNKVAEQVDVPDWVSDKKEFMQSFLRGFFDTDGSVYRLRFGIQISLTNKSLPLLHSLQRMLRALGYSPSAVSACKVYLTKQEDVERFFREVRPANKKHQRRYEEFCVGTEAVKRDAL